MVMRQEFRDSAIARRQSDRNDVDQAFFFDRTYKVFCIGIAVWRARRTDHWLDAFSTQERFEMRGEFIVTGHNQVLVRSQGPVEFNRELPCHLNHQRPVRVRRDACDMDSAGRQVNREQYVVRDGTSRGPDFYGEEIRCCK